MKILKKVKGFTVVELMLVLAILGILCAIAIPNFLSWREKNQAKEKSTQIEMTEPKKSEKLEKL